MPKDLKVERVDFQQVVDALRSWDGRLVSVHIGPDKPPDRGSGLVWAKLRGRLALSGEGAVWDALGPKDQDRVAVAFQVGDDAQTYFVIYREFLEEALWVPPGHHFLEVRMKRGAIGVCLVEPTPDDLGQVQPTVSG